VTTANRTQMDEIIDTYGREAWDLVLTVYVNFYYSELEIIDLCARWIPRRDILKEKQYLLRHASDEISHAGLFREGVELLGLPWDSFDHNKYRIDDIDERFKKLYASDDEVEVLIGLNMYAEGVLAMEEIHQLARNKPQYFHHFERIEREERRHVAFGVTVAKRLLEVEPAARKRAKEYCKWYQEHLEEYLGGELSQTIELGMAAGFVDNDYIPRTRERFHTVMGKLDLLEV
jgi:1,2-phenylacetyl-CoA epoxidase catalytic subunit